MQDLINTIRQHFDTGSYYGEEAVRAHICYPVLRELGWDTNSPVHVVPEYRIKQLRVDIALCLRPSKPAIFIEVKALGKCSSEGQEQVFDYAARQGGIPMVIFTDGNEWHFYNSYGFGDYESRKVTSIRLAKDDPNDCIAVFRRYLQYEEVKTEQAFENLRSDYKRARMADEARLKIPEAWRRLFSDLDERLVDLVVDKVKEVSGGQHIPEKQDVAEFLQGLNPESGSKGTTVPAPRPRPPRIFKGDDNHISAVGTNDQSRPKPPRASKGAVLCRCKIKGEVTEGTSMQVYTRALDYVIAEYGRIEELERQEFNKLNTRTGAGYHIARDKEQVPYEEPHKKKLEQTGIWVNRNFGRGYMASKLGRVGEFYNRVEGRKILGVWGSGAEVEFDIPPDLPRRKAPGG